MEEATPMIMVPSEPMDIGEPSRGRGRPPKRDPTEPDRAWREVLIALKLLVGGGIDSSGQLLDDNKNIVPNADLRSFLNYTVSKGRARIGEEAYIRALQRANVPLEWIINDDIRMKFLNYRNLSRSEPEIEAVSPPQIHREPEVQEVIAPQGPFNTLSTGPRKRGRPPRSRPFNQPEQVEEPTAKKRKRDWEEING